MSNAQGSAGPLRCDPCMGTLTVGEVLLNTSAWCLPDMSSLWSSPALRGQNRLIPGVPGRKAYKRRVDQTTHSLPFAVTGYCDLDGVAYGDRGMSFMEGLEANIAYLQNAFGLDDPTQINADSTFLATFTLPSGNVRQSDVQVTELSGQLRAGALWIGTIEIVDVLGQLIVGGASFV